MAENNSTQLYMVEIFYNEAHNTTHIYANSEAQVREIVAEHPSWPGWTIESVTLYDRAHDTTTTDAGAAT